MTARSGPRTVRPKYPEKSLPDNRTKPIWGDPSETAPYRDQVVCLGHDQVVWSGAAARRAEIEARSALDRAGFSREHQRQEPDEGDEEGFRAALSDLDATKLDRVVDLIKELWPTYCVLPRRFGDPPSSPSLW